MRPVNEHVIYTHIWPYIELRGADIAEIASLWSVGTTVACLAQGRAIYPTSPTSSVGEINNYLHAPSSARDVKPRTPSPPSGGQSCSLSHALRLRGHSSFCDLNSQSFMILTSVSPLVNSLALSHPYFSRLRYPAHCHLADSRPTSNRQQREKLLNQRSRKNALKRPCQINTDRRTNRRSSPLGFIQQEARKYAPTRLSRELAYRGQYMVSSLKVRSTAF